MFHQYNVIKSQTIQLGKGNFNFQSSQLNSQLLLNLVCQFSEFGVLNGCQTSSSKQGFYSVAQISQRVNKFKFEAITSNNINWKPRPEPDLFNDCFKKVESRKGVVRFNMMMCKIGHIGGLCEECDKQNIRGNGYNFKIDQFTCWNYNNFAINILSLILITIWSFFQPSQHQPAERKLINDLLYSN